MAVTMKGEVALPADRMTVWTRLNDPEVLKRCIGALHAMERTGTDTFAATVKVKLGPLGATFKASVVVDPIDAPGRYRIDGVGEGGIAGFARGAADVSLTEMPGGTMLRYDVEAVVGGRLARMGGRLLGGVADRIADGFFARFAAECARAEAVDSAMVAGRRADFGRVSG